MFKTYSKSVAGTGGYEFSYVGAEMSHPSHWTHFDEQSVRDKFWNIKPGDSILDIGAAFGSYSLDALAKGADRIWAWSPQGSPECTEIEIFTSSLKLNGWEDKVSVYWTHGLYDKVGWVDAQSQAFYEQQPVMSSDMIRVETLDSWGESNQPMNLDWIKMDVEGAELHVLKGGVNVIRKYHPKILVENHTFKIPTIESDVRNFLSTLGYREVETVPYHSVSHSLYELK